MNVATRLRFEIPGIWGCIDLATEASRQRSIGRVLAELTNRRDDLADVRADLRRRIETAATAARGGGATDFQALGLDEMSRYLEYGTRERAATDRRDRSESPRPADLFDRARCVRG